MQKGQTLQDKDEAALTGSLWTLGPLTTDSHFFSEMDQRSKFESFRGAVRPREVLRIGVESHEQMDKFDEKRRRAESARGDRMTLV